MYRYILYIYIHYSAITLKAITGFNVMLIGLYDIFTVEENEGLDT